MELSFLGLNGPVVKSHTAEQTQLVFIILLIYVIRL